MGNQEWTIQEHRQHCAKDTERQQTTQHRKLKKLNNADHTKLNMMPKYKHQP